MKFSQIILFVSLALGVFTAARACDFCAVYNITDLHGGAPGFRLGVSEQFTRFGTLQKDGNEVGNDVNQYLNSSITQAAIGYNFNDRFSVQLNVPFIYREFRRPEGTEVREDHTAGLGDLTLTPSYVIIRQQTEKFTFTWTATAGLKFPTGSTRRLKEETEEGHIHSGGEPAEHADDNHTDDDDAGSGHAKVHIVGIPQEVMPPTAHRAEAEHTHRDTHTDATAEHDAPEELPESGIHGHDLSLGSGSWDGLVGTNVYLRYERLFFTAAVQYTIRSKGDYDYRYANDLMWNGGPGVYLALNDRYTVALQANCSGEYKGKDRFRGIHAEDTGVTAVYLGPELSLTYTDRVSIDLGADFPVSVDNTALQIVPDYRLRAAISVRF